MQAQALRSWVNLTPARVLWQSTSRREAFFDRDYKYFAWPPINHKVNTVRYRCHVHKQSPKKFCFCFEFRSKAIYHCLWSSQHLPAAVDPPGTSPIEGLTGQPASSSPNLSNTHPHPFPSSIPRLSTSHHHTIIPSHKWAARPKFGRFLSQGIHAIVLERWNV